jgi:hypothetical protein
MIERKEKEGQDARVGGRVCGYGTMLYSVVQEPTAT